MGFRISNVLALILLVGTVIVSAQPRQTPAEQQPPVKQEEQLPEGEGRAILVAACSACHEVKEVTKFQGTYGPAEWRDLVKSMIVYGAQVTQEEEDVLVDYLNTHFGKE